MFLCPQRAPCLLHVTLIAAGQCLRNKKLKIRCHNGVKIIPGKWFVRFWIWLIRPAKEVRCCHLWRPKQMSCIINPIGLSTSTQAYWTLAAKYIHLRASDTCDCVHKNTLLFPILNYTIPVRACMSYLFKIGFNIIAASTPRYST
jgi:hypothetical protein